jgi:hypothetical protein
MPLMPTLTNICYLAVMIRARPRVLYLPAENSTIILFEITRDLYYRRILLGLVLIERQSSDHYRDYRDVMLIGAIDL